MNDVLNRVVNCLQVRHYLHVGHYGLLTRQTGEKYCWRCLRDKIQRGIKGLNTSRDLIRHVILRFRVATGQHARNNPEQQAQSQIKQIVRLNPNEEMKRKPTVMLQPCKQKRYVNVKRFVIILQISTCTKEWTAYKISLNLTIFEPPFSHFVTFSLPLKKYITTRLTPALLYTSV